MSNFDFYRHLLNIDYDDGDRDCYGLCRRFYLENYDVELPNHARSADFFAEGINLVDLFLKDQDFVVVDVPYDRLQVGDGLLIHMPAPRLKVKETNHVAVFVGNQTFIHHVYGKKSCEEYMNPKWGARLMAVVRHPEVTAKNERMIQDSSANLLDLLPDHVKARASSVFG